MAVPAPTDPYWLETEDWHTAGEPFRIVRDLPAHCTTTGTTVYDRRANIVVTPNHPLDTLRKTLCNEPRGHADMYGGFLVPPNDSGAVLGVLFWHKDGFSTACGHGTIALGCWALAHGIVTAPECVAEATVDVPIDVPSGRVVAQLALRGGKIAHVDFINVPSYQFARSVPVDISRAVSGAGAVSVDIAFSGAVYATLPASAVGLTVDPPAHDDFVRLGRAIKAELGTRAHHGAYDCYGVIFYDDVPLASSQDPTLVLRQKNVTVFADGEVDRSPCGSGSAARLAVLLASGRMREGMTLLHDSIIDTMFEVRAESVDVDGVKNDGGEQFPACVPRIRGMAYLTGRHRFYIDLADPVYPGFLFR